MSRRGKKKMQMPLQYVPQLNTVTQSILQEYHLLEPFGFTNCIPTTPQKENDMYSTVTPKFDKALDQQNYLESRLDRILSDKFGKAEEFFKIDWTDYPKTVGELKQRIADGKFKAVDHGRKDEYKLSPYETDFSSWLTWRTEEADEEGYKAAKEKIRAACTKTKDQLHGDSYADALAALQAFESTTFH